MNQIASTDRRWQHKPLLGTLLMLLGLSLYPLSDAFVKHLMGTYSVPQTSFLRGATRLIPLVIAIFFQGGFKQVFHTNQKGRHAVRLLVNLAYTYTFMLSFSLTSLTMIYTLSYTSSFFMILFSALFLKEAVSKDKWLAVFIGFLGIIIALRPGTSLFQITSLIILAGTILGSLNKILIRGLTKTEHSLAIAIYPNVLMMLATFPFLLNSWQPMPWKDWGLFGVVGLITAGAQYTLAQALRYAKASTLAPIDYSNFIWVLALDLIWWNIIPDSWTLIGAAFIISSNLYILYKAKKEERKT